MGGTVIPEGGTVIPEGGTVIPDKTPPTGPIACRLPAAGGLLNARSGLLVFRSDLAHSLRAWIGATLAKPGMVNYSR